MLRVEKLNFNYGPRQVLKSLSFTVEKGKLVGFLGPNGAGKTTTMNLITGYYYSGDGDIFIDQISMKDRPLEAKKKIGFLSENAPLYPDMIVEDYLSFVCQLKGVFGPNLKHWVNEAIENTRLQEVRGRLISRLSKGYRQRVGLAQAMVAKPDLIVLDEPTVGLDPQQVNEFKKWLRTLQGKTAVLWSTHILADVEDICDEVVVIRQGQIVTQGTTAQIRAQRQGARELVLTVKTPSQAFEQKIRSLPGVENVQWVPEKSRYLVRYTLDTVSDHVLQIAALEKVGVLHLESDRSDLESLFLELTLSEKTEVVP